MGKRGTKRLPDTVKIARGTLRDDRTGDPDLKPQPKMAAGVLPPEFLKDRGLATWEKTRTQLLDLGVLSEIDVSAFGMYCRCDDEIAWCDKVLEEQGHFFTSETGYVGQHPAVNQRFKWIDLKRRYEAEFGMTPSSRSSVIVNKPKSGGVMKRQRTG